MFRTELAKGLSGVISHDVREPYRPSGTPTVTLYKPGGADHQAAASVTVASCNTTVNDAAGVDAGDTSITVTSADSVTPGRAYIIRSVNGNYEWIKVVSKTGAVITIEEPVEFAYEDGATVVGNRLTYSLASSLTGTLGRGYQAIWSYTVNGSDKTVSNLFDVVRTPWPDVILTPWRYKEIVGDLGSDIRPVSYTHLRAHET